MRSILRMGALMLLLAAPMALFASSSLVLTDGQIIKGTEIRRDGDSYLVTMADGNTAVFPAGLVKELRIDDDGPPPTPPPPPAPAGFDTSGPKQLAGPVIPPSSQNTADQLKVLGPPTKWSKDAVDTTWVPTNAYDPNADVMAGSRSTWSKNAVDTEWKPTNAYNPNADVMASSKSTWSKNAVDTEWKPQDGFGFKPLSFKTEAPPAPEYVASLPSSAPYAGSSSPVPSGPAPWTCAEAMFAKDADRPATDKDNRAASLEVHPVKSPLYASLGVPLYEAESKTDKGSQKAVFTIAAGQCRLVGGDADVILGLNLTSDHAMAQDGASFNTAMAARGGARVPSGVDKIDYAFALVSLTDPRVTGARGATLKLLAKLEDMPPAAPKAPTTCALSKGKRRKEERAASAAFAIPKIVAGKEGDIVTFLTWSSAGGVVYRNTVVLTRSGVVSTDRSVIASHVGIHQE